MVRHALADRVCKIADQFVPTHSTACAVDSVTEVIELEVKVAGMQCNGCVERIVEALQVCVTAWAAVTSAVDSALSQCCSAR